MHFLPVVTLNRNILYILFLLFTRLQFGNCKSKKLAIVSLQRFVDTCSKIQRNRVRWKKERNHWRSLVYPHIFQRTESSPFERKIAYTFRALKTRELDRIIPTIQGIHLSLWVPDHVHARTAHLSRSTIPTRSTRTRAFSSFPGSSVNTSVSLYTWYRFSLSKGRISSLSLHRSIDRSEWK